MAATHIKKAKEIFLDSIEVLSEIDRPVVQEQISCFYKEVRTTREPERLIELFEEFLSYIHDANVSKSLINDIEDYHNEFIEILS